MFLSSLHLCPWAAFLVGGRSVSSGFRSRQNSSNLYVSASLASLPGYSGYSDHSIAEVEESEGPGPGVTSFARLLERESVAELLGLVSNSSVQGKTNAAIALGHLARDKELNKEVCLHASVGFHASMSFERVPVCACVCLCVPSVAGVCLHPISLHVESPAPISPLDCVLRRHFRAAGPVLGGLGSEPHIPAPSRGQTRSSYRNDPGKCC